MTFLDELLTDWTEELNSAENALREIEEKEEKERRSFDEILFRIEEEFYNDPKFEEILEKEIVREFGENIIYTDNFLNWEKENFF